jgi:hypothetical protein
MGFYMEIFEARVLGENLYFIESSLAVLCITYFIEGWSILQHDLNNIHFEHCVNL